MDRPLVLIFLVAGCIPETKDFELIPAVTGAQGEVATEEPGAITVRMSVEWVNGESAPETTVTVSPNVAVEDEATADVLGRVRVDRITEFDNVLGPGESESVDYEGTQSPPIPEEGGPDPAVLCDGRQVHLQVQYSTHGSLVDAPQLALSNTFRFDCE
ncbi:MAG: hypothetical protein HYY06_10375 [Deltaproteobacteria bacterium]|nr:hypothetical protein [Deltaproteobacteria bacterium]